MAIITKSEEFHNSEKAGACRPFTPRWNQSGLLRREWLPYEISTARGDSSRLVSMTRSQVLSLNDAKTPFSEKCNPLIQIGRVWRAGGRNDCDACVGSEHFLFPSRLMHLQKSVQPPHILHVGCSPAFTSTPVFPRSISRQPQA